MKATVTATPPKQDRAPAPGIYPSSWPAGIYENEKRSAQIVVQRDGASRAHVVVFSSGLVMGLASDHVGEEGTWTDGRWYHAPVGLTVAMTFEQEAQPTP